MDSTGRLFWELVVQSVPETSEGLTNLLWEMGALGVVEEETPGAAPWLRSFFSETADPRALSAAVSGYLSGLRALGLPAAGEPRVRPCLEEAWAEAWRQSFAPRAVGKRLLIAPPWEVPRLNDGRQPVVIEPGRAFGTGHHGSTLGCLGLIEWSLAHHPVTRALDIGTGTGILAIAAAVLGVSTVTALDIDPDAVASTQRNVERNSLVGRIHCLLTDAVDFSGPPAPLILANLLAGSHRMLGRHYRRLSLAGARLILGGILVEEAQGVVDAMASLGFFLQKTLEEEGWASLALARTE